MATRSTIAVQHKDGSISSAYCHWDGYPSNQSPLLLGFYNGLEQAELLVSGGSLSRLAEKVSPDPGDAHSFESPQDDVCIYYGRDRGETDIHCKVYDTLKDYQAYNDFQEFNYLFSEGHWWLVDQENGPQLLSEFDVTTEWED